MSDANKRYILNLCGELTETLMEYFAKSEINILNRDEVEEYENLDYILVNTGEEAKQAAKDFLAEKNEIQIICLGQVKEIKDFLLYNGRLIIEQEFVESQLGEYILNKFFNKNYNIHLDESFSTLFNEPESFKITNHLNSGPFIDDISLAAFKKGFNVVALRSFLDHVIYYLTYLKQAGLAGVPYEVEYDATENFFVVNLYCPVKNFVAEYMIDSFGPVNSKDPLQYLLGIVARCSDFLEVTYVEKPARLVLTAAWGKSEKKRLNGLSFNNVYTTAQTIGQLNKKIHDYQDVNEQQADKQKDQEQLKPMSLPGNILEMVVSQDEDSILSKEPKKASNIVAFVVAKFEEDYPDRSINDIDEDEFNKILGDYPEQDEINSLTEEDREHLLDRIQKNNITQAYDEEIQRVRDNLEDEDDFKKELQDSMSEEVAKKVSGHLDAESLNKILGGKEEKEEVQKIGGTPEDADDFVAKISGMKDDDTKGKFTQHLGQSFEDKAGEFNQRISGGEDNNKKNMQWMVKSAVSDAAQKSGFDPKVKSFLEENATKRIEQEMDKYAQKLGKSIEDLDENQMVSFKDEVLPDIVSETLEDDFSIDEFKEKLSKGFDRSAPSVLDGMSSDFEVNFKQKLEQRLGQNPSVEKIDGQYQFSDDQLADENMKNVIQETMKETFDESFKLEKANKSEIEKKEKEIIENLSKTLNKDKEEVAQIVKEGTKSTKEKEVQTVVNNIFEEKPGEQEEVIVGDKTFGSNEHKENNEDENTQVKDNNLQEAELIKKLKQKENENKKLQSQMRAMELKLKTSQKSQDKVQELANKAQKEAQEELEKLKNQQNTDEKDPRGDITNLTESESKDLGEKIAKGEKITNDETKRVQDLLKKEQEMLNLLKNAESSTKKAQIEANKKEALFNSELEKANRNLKGKDMVIEKVKESMQTMAQKKDQELKDSMKKIEGLNKRLNNDESLKLKSEVKSLRSDNDSLARQVDMYKNKLDSFIKSKKANEKADNTSALTEEVRQLKGLKNQMENKMNSLIKENKSLDDRFSKTKELEAKFRGESTNLKNQLKDLDTKLKASKDNESRLSALASKAQKEGANGSNKKEVEHLKSQVSQLQGKLKDIIEKGKNGAAASGGGGANANISPKEKHLEKTNKKLQSEITKAKGELDTTKKEMMKMKGESTGLKNKIRSLEKEIERFKKASKSNKKKAA